MERRTLKFQSLIDLARFSKVVSTGYLMNTNNYTLTGKFIEEDIVLARQKYNGREIDSTDKVFTYGS